MNHFAEVGRSHWEVTCEFGLPDLQLLGQKNCCGLLCRVTLLVVHGLDQNEHGK